MIRSTKRCLIKVGGWLLLNFSELGTILVEIEAVINSRPVTYVFDDSDGISYALMPSQLINGRNLAMLPNERHHKVVNYIQKFVQKRMFSSETFNPVCF